jgi:uroporphyrinogen III methyltransferase/synthase
MSKVYLVGAGPGDPDLITWKGRKLLAQADAVLYDNLAAADLLELAPRHAERIYVGKKRAEHPYRQDEICRMLIERARRGQTVVRLKGGDPFIFGRGGEEAEALADAGIDFEVVPGVTTPLGVAAYCGVPLTHREYTSVVTFVTGHDVERIDWQRVAAAEMLVLFMGWAHFGEIARRLIACGKPPETPALAVRWATRPDQKTLAGTLADLPRLVAEAGMTPPVTILIGETVRLRDKLNWFERLPLFGRRIVVTRAAEQAPALVERLRSLGAAVIELPAIAIRPLEDYSALDAAIGRLAEYDWLVFTSVNGVRFFFERLDRSCYDVRRLPPKLCAIGPATRRALEQLHLKVDLMPEEYVAEALVAAFSRQNMRGKRVLLARAAAARELLPEELGRLGASVDVVPAYRTVVPEDAAGRARQVFARPPDWVLFTSSSTVKNLVAAAGREALAGVRIASIGPVTSETVRSFGLEVAAEARPYTIDGLIEAVLCETNRKAS